MNCTKPGDSIIAYFDVWILNKISWILGGGVAYMGARRGGGRRRRPGNPLSLLLSLSSNQAVCYARLVLCSRPF